jgi:hypothetical protein
MRNDAHYPLLPENWSTIMEQRHVSSFKLKMIAQTSFSLQLAAKNCA